MQKKISETSKNMTMNIINNKKNNIFKIAAPLLQFSAYASS